jgi:hypothetical protein
LIIFYFRLIQLEVASLDDVYWLEDSKVRSLLGKDFVTWAAARQALPTSKDDLAQLKGELWSAVVKSTQHEDAWTWGEAHIVCGESSTFCSYEEMLLG